MNQLALAQAAGDGGTPGWVPAVVGLVLGLAVIAVIALAVSQRSRRNRNKRPRPRCSNCGQPLGASATLCPHCGWTAPPPLGSLELIYGPLEGQSFPLHGEITTIGSQMGNTIVIPDTGVSRKHVGIRRDATGYEIADLGSTNGIYINGQRMAKRLLSEGDIIRIGSSEMVFHLEKVG